MTVRKEPAYRYRRRVRLRAEELPEVLSTDEAASLLGTGVNRIRRLVRDGELTRLPWGGRAIRIAKADVLAYMQRVGGAR